MNEKQSRFVTEYLIDLNATQAAIRAGYSAKTAYAQGDRLLKHDEVRAAVTAGQTARGERTHVDQDYVITNLCEIVERCMQRAPTMVREGRRLVQAKDGEGRTVWTFNGKVAVAALSLLAKHTGGFTERHEVTGKDGEPLMTLEMVRSLLKGETDAATVH